MSSSRGLSKYTLVRQCLPYCFLCSAHQRATETSTEGSAARLSARKSATLESDTGASASIEAFLAGGFLSAAAPLDAGRFAKAGVECFMMVGLLLEPVVGLRSHRDAGEPTDGAARSTHGTAPVHCAGGGFGFPGSASCRRRSRRRRCAARRCASSGSAHHHRRRAAARGAIPSLLSRLWPTPSAARAPRRRR